MQLLELLLADLLRGELGREPLELRAHLVGAADLPGREAADERAAVRTELDEPARLQLAQRLPDRRPADAELLGESLLAQPGPGRKRAVEHARVQGGSELVDERPAFLDGLGHGCVLRTRPSCTSLRPTTADEGGEDEAQRRGGKREREQHAEHAADRADDAEAQCEPEVADPAAPQGEVPTIAVGRMTSSEVASAACCESPAASVRNGTISVPPPTAEQAGGDAGEHAEDGERRVEGRSVQPRRTVMRIETASRNVPKTVFSTRSSMRASMPAPSRAPRPSRRRGRARGPGAPCRRSRRSRSRRC